MVRGISYGMVAVGAIALSSCGGPDWVKVNGATADGPDETVVFVGLDVCHPDPEVIPESAVVETDTEIRVRLPMKHSGGDEDACAVALPVMLDSPIGNRVVIDDRTGRRFVIAYNG